MQLAAVASRGAVFLAYGDLCSSRQWHLAGLSSWHMATYTARGSGISWGCLPGIFIGKHRVSPGVSSLREIRANSAPLMTSFTGQRYNALYVTSPRPGPESAECRAIIARRAPLPSQRDLSISFALRKRGDSSSSVNGMILSEHLLFDCLL